MQAADLGVQVDQAGGETGQTPVAAVGLGGHGHRAMQGVGEGNEPLGDAPGLGQGVELLFRRLDLVAGRKFGVALGGHAGNVAADPDQVAAERQVIDRAGIVGGIGGRRGAVYQVRQIADPAQFRKAHVPGELLGHQDRLGQLTLADVTFDGREQTLVEGLEEMATLQIVADPLEGGVVIEQRAQQRLFGLDIGGRVGDRHIVGDGAQVECGYEGHGLPIAQGRARDHRDIAARPPKSGGAVDEAPTPPLRV